MYTLGLIGIIGASIVTTLLWYDQTDVSTAHTSTQEAAYSDTQVGTPVIPQDAVLKTLLVSGGCFWTIEGGTEKLTGVIDSVSGYAGGDSTDPTYNNYKEGGHREAVEVTFDANQTSFAEVVIKAIKYMDPTDGEGSFYDRGYNYSPALYYETAEEKAIIEGIIAHINEAGPFATPLAIKVEPRPTFYAAEAEHQNYYKRPETASHYAQFFIASGRQRFIDRYWKGDTSATLPGYEE